MHYCPSTKYQYKTDQPEVVRLLALIQKWRVVPQQKNFNKQFIHHIETADPLVLSRLKYLWKLNLYVRRLVPISNTTVNNLSPVSFSLVVLLRLRPNGPLDGLGRLVIRRKVSLSFPLSFSLHVVVSLLSKITKSSSYRNVVNTIGVATTEGGICSPTSSNKQ
jgi:hypothetical protein